MPPVQMHHQESMQEEVIWQVYPLQEGPYLLRPVLHKVLPSFFKATLTSK